MSRFVFALTALGMLSIAYAAAAEPFVIDLQVSCGKASQTAHAESAAADARPHARPLLEVKAGERISVHWKFSGADATNKIEDVTVHFIAVQEDQPNQPPPHKPGKGVAAESALIMDVGPKDANESELAFTIDKAGYYLFRVETIEAVLGGAPHEDFAALDVKVH